MRDIRGVDNARPKARINPSGIALLEDSQHPFKIGTWLILGMTVKRLRQSFLRRIAASLHPWVLGLQMAGWESGSKHSSGPLR